MFTVLLPRLLALLFPTLLAGAFFALAMLQSPGAKAEQERIAIHISEMAESGSPPTWRVDQGSEVVLVVMADEPSELHLHGYDLRVDASAGHPGEMRFDASVAGRFPLTRHGRDEGSHGHDTPVGYLEIYPN